jgi:two-component system chemotaxis sensor kinase CheA
VKEKVERLGGKVMVNTQAGAGTVFRLTLPLSLARFRGILIRVSEQVFVVPTIHVHQVLRIRPASIKTAGNRETIELAGQAVALVRLRAVFGLEECVEEQTEHIQVIVLGHDEQRIAFTVNEIVSEQEVLAKNFGKQLSRVRNFSGAAVLGSGKVVPIINVHDLMKSAIDADVPAPVSPASGDEPVKSKSLLVVEDSITARTLLKNILESAGYAVKTAVDGMDGFTTLRDGHFDLVISDVEMPRMNGLDLTAKIRADRKLADVPVILVTALDSRHDRERGIDVGANAYIVKSSFDQANLLDAVRRLI